MAAAKGKSLADISQRQELILGAGSNTDWIDFFSRNGKISKLQNLIGKGGNLKKKTKCKELIYLTKKNITNYSQYVNVGLLMICSFNSI